MFLSLFCVSLISLRILVSSEDTTENDFVPRVVNGWPAKLGDVPYQLAFKQLVSRRSGMYRTFCGGVIIAPKKVLSAAHCFEEKKGLKCCRGTGVSARHLAKIMAVAGNLYNAGRFQRDSKENGQWRRLQSMVYPAKYRFPRNDISVGFTKSPFSINEFVAPIPYTNRFAEYIGTCLASGYGRISNQANVGSEVLLLAHLTVVPTSKCSAQHRRNMVKFVCTDIYNADVAKGDSGGPLVCSKTGDPKEGPKGILVGIVSGSRLRVGTFFTRVSTFARYIDRGKSTSRSPNVALILYCLINGASVLFLFCFFFNPRRKEVYV